MITAIDLKKAVNSLIDSNFDSEVLANKVKDGFKAPAFFTKIETVNMDYETKLRNFEQYRIEIHYFPKVANDDIDILKVQSELRNIFDRTLQVEDRYLEIFKITERVHEGTLFFNFNLQFEQYKDVEKHSWLMNEIITERKDD